MKGLILQGSSRANGDTAKAVAALAKQTGWPVVTLCETNISAYDYEGKNQGDDFLPLMRDFVANYDLLCLATPIYWYTMSGLLKNFLDRITDLLTLDKPTGRLLRSKKLAFISVNHEDEATQSFEVPFVLSAEYLGMEYKGTAHLNMEDGLTKEVKRRLMTFVEVVSTT